ncbi:hypothetical protein BU16DRAFT_562296 [Lophium mytilinum]|uniref:Uncharacterized protein n=1 Tax=Lophium mytilinum TaxID=390894 RepID=A0A6A6QR61_9PEZI|nr:hypothetical protein BU16DRAFT_562296 [Lophium mytilinum]
MPVTPSTPEQRAGHLKPAIASTPKTTTNQPTPSHRVEILGDIRRNWSLCHQDQILPSHLTPTGPTSTWRDPVLSQDDIAHIALLYRLDHGAGSTPSEPIPVLKYTLHEQGVCVRNPTKRAPPAGWASAVLDVTAEGVLVERLERGEERRELGAEEWSGGFVRAVGKLSELTKGRKEEAWRFLDQAQAERGGREVTTRDVRRAGQIVGERDEEREK